MFCNCPDLGLKKRRLIKSCKSSDSREFNFKCHFHIENKAHPENLLGKCKFVADKNEFYRIVKKTRLNVEKVFPEPQRNMRK